MSGQAASSHFCQHTEYSLERLSDEAGRGALHGAREEHSTAQQAHAELIEFDLLFRIS